VKIDFYYNSLRISRLASGFFIIIYEPLFIVLSVFIRLISLAVEIRQMAGIPDYRYPLPLFGGHSILG
jgi:hypothetical protein